MVRHAPLIAARRSDYTVVRALHRDVVPFIREYHYSKACANTSVLAFVLGRNADSEMIGAALWMPPTKNAAMSVNREHWTRVLTLSRLAIAPGAPTNCASLLIGGMIRAIRTEGKWVSLVTYADEAEGHTGAIYKATNWTYAGASAPTPRWVDGDGVKVSRLATKTRTDAEMRALGYVRLAPSRKLKFVMHL